MSYFTNILRQYSSIVPIFSLFVYFWERHRYHISLIFSGEHFGTFFVLFVCIRKEFRAHATMTIYVSTLEHFLGRPQAQVSCVLISSLSFAWTGTGACLFYTPIFFFAERRKVKVRPVSVSEYLRKNGSLFRCHQSQRIFLWVWPLNSSC